LTLSVLDTHQYLERKQIAFTYGTPGKPRKTMEMKYLILNRIIYSLFTEHQGQVERANFTIKRLTSRAILGEVKKAISSGGNFEEITNVSHTWTQPMNDMVKIYNNSPKQVTGF